VPDAQREPIQTDTAPMVDLFVEVLAADKYIVESQAPPQQLAAAGWCDLRPLDDDFAPEGWGEELLADILVESAMLAPL